MDLRIAGKTAVVTGAGRGIGLATVETLLKEGSHVVAAARTITPELRATAAHAITADLSTAGGTADLIDYANTTLGGIDFLVNNVGGVHAPSEFLATDDTHWDDALALNLLSAVRTTRLALPSLIERHGAIVNVSSTVAHTPSNAPAPYSAAKAALTAFGKSLAEEYGPRGIRINTVSPGLVRTPVYDTAATNMGISTDQLVEQILRSQNVTTGRMSAPSEVANLIAFLLSKLSANITGANYIIDGGGLKSV